MHSRFFLIHIRGSTGGWRDEHQVSISPFATPQRHFHIFHNISSEFYLLLFVFLPPPWQPTNNTQKIIYRCMEGDISPSVSKPFLVRLQRRAMFYMIHSTQYVRTVYKIQYIKGENAVCVQWVFSSCYSLLVDIADVRSHPHWIYSVAIESTRWWCAER